MTKKHLSSSITPIAGATLLALAFSSCAQIADLRRPPSEWGTPLPVKEKTVKVNKVKKEKSGGFFDFFKRKNTKTPQLANNLTNPAPAQAALNQAPTGPVTLPTIPKQQAVIKPVQAPVITKAPPVVTNPVSQVTAAPPTVITPNSGPTSLRTVGDLIMPDAGELPTPKDLQEAPLITPVIPTIPGGISLPGE